MKSSYQVQEAIVKLNKAFPESKGKTPAWAHLEVATNFDDKLQDICNKAGIAFDDLLKIADLYTGESIIGLV